MIKICSTCALEKSLSDFYFQRGKPNSQCKKCKTLTNERWKEKNPEKVALIKKNWAADNHDKVHKSKRDWVKRNPEKDAESRKKWYHKEGAAQKRLRLLKALRVRVLRAIKGNKKVATTLSLVGCSVERLCEHLESQFRSGMVWENRGTVWHIDHIKPCAKFDLTDPEQQKKCFHYTNLQPLFAEENFKKGARE